MSASWRFLDLWIVGREKAMTVRKLSSFAAKKDRCKERVRAKLMAGRLETAVEL